MQTHTPIARTRMPGAIVIGASSGIGAALARVLAREGYAVGLAARRQDMLEQLQSELPARTFVKSIDVSDPAAAIPRLQQLIGEMGDVELFVLSAGVGFLNRPLEWAPEAETIAVNVTGFAAMLNVSLHSLRSRGAGQIVGISSISALRGGRHAPAYNASKAFVSNYMEGIRQYCHKHALAITVLDVQPGFVDTPMAKGPGRFWMASADKAAEQIWKAIRRRRSHVYITRRWRLIAWLLKALPRRLYERM